MSKEILLVDDEVAILRALQRVFTRAGYRVFICESGAAGLALLAEQPVSLIISDFRMPGILTLIETTKIMRHPIWKCHS